jgi:NADPH-dependent 2,4-dienoyl-CoA reductase/sulfur reductase-like enzyme
VGREREYELIKTENPRNILVIGGGPAGMEAARVAALRGHSVIMYEKNKELGGQLRLACKPPHKEELRNIVNYYSTQLKNLGVHIELGRTADESTVAKSAPDAVILAAGAVPLVPNISGIKSSIVVTAWDVLEGTKISNEKTVVVGGGEVGCETAEYIASSGAKVTVTEMLDYVGGDVELLTRRLLLDRLRSLGVNLVTNAKAVNIIEKGVYVTSQGGAREFFEASKVVLATGSKPKNELANSLNKVGVEAHAIGDCVEPRGVLEAIREGSQVGRLI